jgi:hypothetical protein
VKVEWLREREVAAQRKCERDGVDSEMELTERWRWKDWEKGKVGDWERWQHGINVREMELTEMEVRCWWKCEGDGGQVLRNYLAYEQGNFQVRDDGARRKEMKEEVGDWDGGGGEVKESSGWWKKRMTSLGLRMDFTKLKTSLLMVDLSSDLCLKASEVSNYEFKPLEPTQFIY